jgi:hypothetical protein
MRRQLAATASAGILILASAVGTASAQTGYGFPGPTPGQPPTGSGYPGPTLGQPPTGSGFPGPTSGQPPTGSGYPGPTSGQPPLCQSMDPAQCASPPTAPQSGATVPDLSSLFPGTPGASPDSSGLGLTPLALPPLPFPERGPYLPTSSFSPFYWGPGPASAGFPNFPGFGFPDPGFPPLPILPPAPPSASPPSTSPPGQVCILIFPPPPGC